jgi:hypothetical protein
VAKVAVAFCNLVGKSKEGVIKMEALKNQFGSEVAFLSRRCVPKSDAVEQHRQVRVNLA